MHLKAIAIYRWNFFKYSFINTRFIFGKSILQIRLYSSLTGPADNFPPAHLDLNQFKVEERKRIHVIRLKYEFLANSEALPMPFNDLTAEDWSLLISLPSDGSAFKEIQRMAQQYERERQKAEKRNLQRSSQQEIANSEPTGLKGDASDGGGSLIARLERENRALSFIGFIRPRSMQAFATHEAHNALRWGQPLLLDLWHLVESARATASASARTRHANTNPIASPERVFQLNLAHALGKVRQMMDHLLSENNAGHEAPFAVTVTSAPLLPSDPSTQVASKWLFGPVADGISTLRESAKYPFGVTSLYYKDAIAALNWEDSGPWSEAHQSSTCATLEQSREGSSCAPSKLNPNPNPNVVYIVHTALEPLRQFDPRAIYVLPLFGAKPPDIAAHALTLARAAKRDRVHAVRLPLREFGYEQNWLSPNLTVRILHALRRFSGRRPTVDEWRQILAECLHESMLLVNIHTKQAAVQTQRSLPRPRK